MPDIPIILLRLDKLVNSNGVRFYSQNRKSRSGFFVSFDREDADFSKFLEELPGKDLNFYRPIIDQHAVLTIEYSVIRASIANDLANYSRDPKSEKEEQLKRKLKALWALAAVLERVHREYLIVAREVNRLQRDQEEYRQWLSQLNLEIKFKQNLIPPNPYANVAFLPQPIRDYLPVSTQNIRRATGDLNPIRLFLLRLRRLCLLIEIVLHDYEHYGKFLHSIDNAILMPFFRYFAWVFFLPRLLMNLGIIAWHVLFPRTKEEIALGWQARLEIHAYRRWSDLSNDTAWFLSGILTCFILTGPLLPFVSYLGIFMQLYDLTLSCIRLHIELSRLCNLREEYRRMDQGNVAEADVSALNRRIHLERKILYARVLNFLVLFIATCLTLPGVVISFWMPGLVLHPLIPIFGAAMAVLITIFNYQVTQVLERGERANLYDMPFPEIRGCASLDLDKMPANLADLRSKRGIFSSAYIRIDSKIYYVNKKRVDELTDLSREDYTTLCSNLNFTKVLVAVPIDNLKEVYEITKHTEIVDGVLQKSCSDIPPASPGVRRQQSVGYVPHGNN